MDKRVVAWLLLGLLLCAAGAAEGAAVRLPARDAPPHRPGNVLVKWRGEAAGPALAEALAAQAASVQAIYPGPRLARLQTPIGQEAAVAAALRGRPEVVYAELDYMAGAATTADLQLPNDPEFPRQWGLTKINAPAAWSVITGAVSITMAVVDSGIDLGHPDLAPQLWANPDEIPGNGADDDANGKIDDVYGWHLFQAANGPAEDARVQDDFGHGTHVAGIAAAATDNGIGIAGVAAGARIMAVKVLDQYGNGWYSDIIAGIVYAADNGAQLINLSLGGATSSQALCDAAAYAESRGALVIAAAGNTGGAVLYPAACPAALAVAATDQLDARPGFSNYGAQIELAAPGVNIYSTWYAVGIGASGYFTRSGTSMAAPHVTGAAALIWSRWPTWTADQVRQQLITTADDVNTKGWDPYSGWGRLNAAAALGWSHYRYFYPFMAAQAPDSVGRSPATASLIATPPADTPAPERLPRPKSRSDGHGHP